MSAGRRPTIGTDTTEHSRAAALAVVRHGAGAARPVAARGSVLVVDGCWRARTRHRRLIAGGLPGHIVRTAYDGGSAFVAMAAEVPGLVVLDLELPDMDGLDVLDRMRSDPRLRDVPVLVLTGRPLTLADVGRLAPHAQVTLRVKGILPEEETLRAVRRALGEADPLPRHTGELVLRMLVHLHRNYAHPLTRPKLALLLGVSEDYLSKVFHREFGMPLWEYLNRLRIHHAKLRLLNSGDKIQAVAHRVGFRDQAYFNRVFRKHTGLTPGAFRARADLDAFSA